MPHTPVTTTRLIPEAAADLWLADDEREIRFLANLFTQVSLPYKDPGDHLRVWGRRNGNLTLTVVPGADYDNDEPVPIGYPFGTVPRLLLSWLSTEAVRTKNPVISLGDSLTAFMTELGMAVTGGRTGTIARLRTQMNRLFRANMSVHVKDDPTRDTGGSVSVASAYDLWWSNANQTQSSLLSSTVKLTQEFFEEVCRRPVPLDLGALRALRGSAQRLDLYSWLTYRMSYLSKPTLIPWESLRAQFGANFKDTRQGRSQFKRDFVRHLLQVLDVYPQAKVEITDVGLMLYPSPTHVPFRGLAALAATPTGS